MPSIFYDIFGNDDGTICFNVTLHIKTCETEASQNSCSEKYNGNLKTETIVAKQNAFVEKILSP